MPVHILWQKQDKYKSFAHAWQVKLLRGDIKWILFKREWESVPSLGYKNHVKQSCESVYRFPLLATKPRPDEQLCLRRRRSELVFPVLGACGELMTVVSVHVCGHHSLWGLINSHAEFNTRALKNNRDFLVGKKLPTLDWRNMLAAMPFIILHN